MHAACVYGCIYGESFIKQKKKVKKAKKQKKIALFATSPLAYPFRKQMFCCEYDAMRRDGTCLPMRYGGGREEDEEWELGRRGRGKQVALFCICLFLPFPPSGSLREEQAWML